MLPEKNIEYRIFKSDQMVARKETKEFFALPSDKKKNIFIVEGDRGAGKTYFLLDLYRHYLQDKTKRAFFIGLFHYKAPEFSKNPNIWLQENRKFEISDIPNLLRKIVAYLGIDFIDTLDPENQREYLAKKLAQRTSGDRPVVLFDSIYECGEPIRKQIERDILIPLLASNQVTVILSGRGKRPIWTSPEFRNAEYIKLQPPGKQFVHAQLEKMKSKHVGEFEKITEWSGGCPLVVRILGKAEIISLESLNKAIDVLIKESLLVEIKDYVETREAMQKLALFKAPFRDLDVVHYLFLENPEGRSRTKKLVNFLLDNYLLEWDDTGERRGYMMNKTIAHPLHAWLTGYPEKLKQYYKEWEMAVEALINAYPSVKREQYITMMSYNNK